MGWSIGMCREFNAELEVLTEVVQMNCWRSFICSSILAPHWGVHMWTR